MNHPDPRHKTFVAGNLAKVKVGDVIVTVDPRYYRPTEVETLLGDPTKAKVKLGGTPRTTFAELVKEMIEADYISVREGSLVNMAGFRPMSGMNELHR